MIRPLKVKGSPYPILAIGSAREHDPTPCGVLGVLRGSANGLTATGSQVFPPNVLPQGVDDYCQTVSAVLG